MSKYGRVSKYQGTSYAGYLNDPYGVPGSHPTVGSIATLDFVGSAGPSVPSDTETQIANYPNAETSGAVNYTVDAVAGTILPLSAGTYRVSAKIQGVFPGPDPPVSTIVNTLRLYTGARIDSENIPVDTAIEELSVARDFSLQIVSVMVFETPPSVNIPMYMSYEQNSGGNISLNTLGQLGARSVDGMRLTVQKIA